MGDFKVGYLARGFRLKDLAVGSLEILARFREKVYAQQVFLTSLKYGGKATGAPEITEGYIDELVRELIAVIKRFYNKYPDQVQDIVIIIGDDDSTLLTPENAYTVNKKIVMGILAPEVLAHELGHIVDNAQAPIRKKLSSLARLASGVASITSSGFAGGLAASGRIKQAFVVPLATAKLQLIADSLTRKAETKASDVARDMSPEYFSKNEQAQRILDEAGQTYSLSNSLKHSVAPMAGASLGAILGGYAVNKARQKGTNLSIGAEVAGVIAPSIAGGLLAKALIRKLDSHQEGKAANVLDRVVADPLHKGLAKVSGDMSFLKVFYRLKNPIVR